MSTEISRKKKLRGAHLASAKRLLKTVSELLVSLDPNKLDEITPRLNQLKTSIQEKLAILRDRSFFIRRGGGGGGLAGGFACFH